MNSWKRTKLRGKIHVKHGFPFLSEAFAEQGRYVVLTPGNFFEQGGFKRNAEKDKCYSISFPPEYLLKKGDLIVAMTEQAEGLLGSTALIPEDDKFLHNQRLGLITATTDEVDLNYLYHLFKTASVRRQIRLSATGSKVKHTAPDRLYEEEVSLPDRGTPKKNASVLSALDAKIELNNQINAELEGMAKLLYDYWFVQYEFPMTAAQAASLGRPALEGKPYKSSGGKLVPNETLNRPIPEGWEASKLVNLTSLIQRGVSPKYVETGGISVLNQKCIRNQSIQFHEARRHGIELEDSHDRLLRHLDVVVNSTGVGTLGRVAFVKRLEDSKTTVDSHVTIVRADEKLISKSYLVWSMRRLQPVIEAVGVGSTGQVELSKSQLEQLDLIVPNRDTQSRFTEFTKPIIETIACNEKQYQELTALRDWLLPLLMNGQVTVLTEEGRPRPS